MYTPGMSRAHSTQENAWSHRPRVTDEYDPLHDFWALNTDPKRKPVSDLKNRPISPAPRSSFQEKCSETMRILHTK